MQQYTISSLKLASSCSSSTLGPSPEADKILHSSSLCKVLWDKQASLHKGKKHCGHLRHLSGLSKSTWRGPLRHSKHIGLVLLAGPKTAGWSITINSRGWMSLKYSRKCCTYCEFLLWQPLQVLTTRKSKSYEVPGSPVESSEFLWMSDFKGVAIVL